MNLPILFHVAAHIFLSQMEQMKSHSVRLYNESKRGKEKERALKEASLKFMAQRSRIMEEINAEKKLKLQEERHILVL
jgi:hypothetical protein